MDQATIEWLPTANGCWIGCTEKGKVVYKNDMLKDAWESDDGEDVRKAKKPIKDWAESKKRRAVINKRGPNAFGGQALKDKDLKSEAALADGFKAKATQAVNKAYGIS